MIVNFESFSINSKAHIQLKLNVSQQGQHLHCDPSSLNILTREVFYTSFRDYTSFRQALRKLNLRLLYITKGIRYLEFSSVEVAVGILRFQLRNFNFKIKKAAQNAQRGRCRPRLFLSASLKKVYQ